MLNSKERKIVIKQLGYTSTTRFFNIQVMINLILLSQRKMISKNRVKEMLQINERTIYRYVSEVPFLEMNKGFVYLNIKK